MTSTLSPALLDEFSHFIANEIGLHFPKEKWSDLEKGILAATHAFKFNQTEACVHWLMSTQLNKTQIEILASELTVGETYFFRDSNLFKALEETILPQLIYKRFLENKKYLRIWSAGCATGEEPYTIAMVLHKLIPDIKHWNITLLATDINTDFLNKLVSGIYTEWSFRGVSKEIKNTFFTRVSKSKYEIIPAIKKMVEPEYLNLASNSFPSLTNNTNAMDIIFCRNVLMYFTPELACQIVKRFFDCLADQGCLIVSAIEVPQPYFNDFNRETINSSVIYIRQDKPLITPFEQPISIVVPSVITPPKQVEALKKTITTQDYKLLTHEYANKGMLEEALLLNDKAISENKIDVELYYLRASILLELERYNEAIIALKKVIYLDPEFVLAYFVLGNIYNKKRKVREANKQFEQALILLSNFNAEDLIGDVPVARLIEVIRSTKVVDKVV